MTFAQRLIIVRERMHQNPDVHPSELAAELYGNQDQGSITAVLELQDLVHAEWRLFTRHEVRRDMGLA